jgi:hypothetical protein
LHIAKAPIVYPSVTESVVRGFSVLAVFVALYLQATELKSQYQVVFNGEEYEEAKQILDSNQCGSHEHSVMRFC